MRRNENDEKSFVKNSSGFHPEGDIDQNLPQPSAAIPPGVDVYGNLEKALRDLSTQELQERAGQLAISGHRQMNRDQLVEALQAYSRKNSPEFHH